MKSPHHLLFATAWVRGMEETQDVWEHPWNIVALQDLSFPLVRIAIVSCNHVGYSLLCCWSIQLLGIGCFVFWTLGSFSDPVFVTPQPAAMNELDAELLILWLLTGAAVGIMLLRLGLRKYRRQSLELGDYLTIAAIIALLLRSAVIHVALVWGTNVIKAALRASIKFTSDEIYRREVGSKLTIVNRVFYTVYSWLQKCVVMCVLQRLLQGLKSPIIVRLYWAFLAVTFIIAFVFTFVECHPFQRYWQVTPDPGTCPKGNIQLIVFSVLNMLTDLMLIVLPLPDLLKIKRPLISKIRLILLFLVGLTIVAVTLTRLLMNLVLLGRTGQSHDVANVELFFEAFVANAPTTYGLLRIEGRRQQTVNETHSYLPGSWSGSGGSAGNGGAGSKSAQSDVVISRCYSEPNRRHPRKLMLTPGVVARHGNESDEEMMIELSDSASSSSKSAAAGFRASPPPISKSEV